MEALPVYYARSEHRCLLAGQKLPLRTQRPDVASPYRLFILVSALGITLLLVAAAVLGNEPFVPTLAAFIAEWWCCLTATFRRRPDGLTTISEPSWEGLKGGEHCLRYATRQYTARLSNGPAGHDMMKACKEIPVEIHGDMAYTDFCQDLGFNRGIWGYWIVDSNESDCETRFEDFTDMGCSGGVGPARRIEAHLENLREGDDWQFMCVTTPADIGGRYYLTPTECFNQGRWGVYGIWDLHDDSCSVFHNVTGQTTRDEAPTAVES